MKIPRREMKRARIEIVPMIDTMVFLLVFFMMASLAMTPMNSMKVNLPRASSGEKMNAARVILTMTKEGEIFMNRQRTAPGEVTEALRAKIAANPETQVIINADRGLNYGRVIALMDAAKLANPRLMWVATEPNPSVR